MAVTEHHFCGECLEDGCALLGERQALRGEVRAAQRRLAAIESADPTWAEFVPTHRHYKGGLYRVTDVLTHAETKQKLVSYDDADGNAWVRASEEFYGSVELPSGVRVQRFERLPEGEAHENRVLSDSARLRLLQKHPQAPFWRASFAEAALELLVGPEYAQARDFVRELNALLGGAPSPAKEAL